jgi:NitT/TauT family transport system substrate-binding protein
MSLTRRELGFLLGGLATLPAPAALGQTLAKVKVGQATPSISFLPMMAARAFGSFRSEGVDLEWAAVPGGDPTALAALDSGDVDLAAVGSDTALRAIGRGQPFRLVYSLMSKITLDLVLSNEILDRTGTKPSDPLTKRLAALKGATIGVSAIGGTQDSAARWLAAQGGLNPRTDLQVALVGPPPAIQAAFENKRIDGFVLSPPEGLLAEDARTGRVIVRMGDDFSERGAIPYLVLVAKTPIAEAKRPALVATCRALQKASAEITGNAQASAQRIQQAFFPRVKPEIMAAAVESLKSGVAGGGRFEPAALTNLIRFIGDVGGNPGAALDPKAENGFWTNAYIDEARKA